MLYNTLKMTPHSAGPAMRWKTKKWMKNWILCDGCVYKRHVCVVWIFTWYKSQRKTISQPVIIKQLNCSLTSTQFSKSNTASQLNHCYSISMWRGCFLSLNTVFQQCFTVWMCCPHSLIHHCREFSMYGLPSASRRVQSIKASLWPTYL